MCVFFLMARNEWSREEPKAASELKVLEGSWAPCAAHVTTFLIAPFSTCLWFGVTVALLVRCY